jgi:hypothetical protein
MICLKIYDVLELPGAVAKFPDKRFNLTGEGVG